MRIAHLTDLHVLDLGSARPWSFFDKRLLGGLNLLRRSREHRADVVAAAIAAVNEEAACDHVVVTGDLTNLSFESEFAAARRLVDGLRHGPRDVTIIPGNHDTYTRGAARRGGFGAAFAAYIEGDDGASAPTVRLRGEVAVVGLSTAVPSPPLCCYGELGDAQLERLEQALAADEVRARFRLLLIHHPPWPKPGERRNGLRDRPRLAEILERVGADLVLHGHEHRELRNELRGPGGAAVPVVGLTSTSYVGRDPARRARFNVYVVERRAWVATERWEYDVDRARFARLPPG